MTSARVRIVWGVSVAALTAAHAVPGVAAQETEAPLVIDVQEAEWGPPGTAPRFPRGVRTAQLGTDPDNGGPIYFARFPPGSHFDLHWHTHAEYAVVLAGRGTLVLGEDTHELTPGTYLVIPERLNHSWDVPPGGSDLVLFVRRRGPADFNFVER